MQFNAESGQAKNSPFDDPMISAKKKRNVGILMLQGQQTKLVGRQCFNAELNYSI
jgi:hypothetical protein